jgi:hypothetical protein
MNWQNRYPQGINWMSKNPNSPGMPNVMAVKSTITIRRALLKSLFFLLIMLIIAVAITKIIGKIR